MKVAENMKLTEDPELVTWPEMHYVFVERIGPFMENAGAAWQQAHPLVPALLENNKITGYMALYKGPKILPGRVFTRWPTGQTTRRPEV